VTSRAEAKGGGAVTLGEIADRPVDALEVGCARCERRGRLSVAKLIACPV
jgi:hypothetical protein